MSTRLSAYLNQTATWKRVTGYNGDGSPKTTAQTISVRKESYKRLTRNSAGAEVMSETTVLTTEAIQPGDMIDNVEVITVLDMVWTDGTTEGYEALL